MRLCTANSYDGEQELPVFTLCLKSGDPNTVFERIVSIVHSSDVVPFVSATGKPELVPHNADPIVLGLDRPVPAQVTVKVPP